MKLVFTQKAVEAPVLDCYQITVEYEHGDADSHTTDVVSLPGRTAEQIIAYLTKFKEVADQIQDARSYGGDSPSYIRDCDMCIAVPDAGPRASVYAERDLFAMHTVSDYYASMRIKDITYFDPEGKQFKVDAK